MTPLAGCAPRLVAMVRKSGAGANEHKSEFAYDYASRRRSVKEYEWSNGAWQLQSEKYFVYAGMQMVQERGGDGSVLASYVWDGNVGGLLSKRDSAGDDYFYHYDGSGNVTELTDAQQNTVAEYSYDAYGNTLTASGSQAAGNPFRYSTKWLHGQSGLYDYGYRFYSPGLGRWINRDPIKESGGLNLYAAFANSPTNIADAYGLATDPPGKSGRIRVVFNAFIP